MMNKKGAATFQLLLIFFSLFAFAFLMSDRTIVSASSANYCCEKTEYGASCQNEATCNEDYNMAPTSCEYTSYCQSGTCYNSIDGICMANTPRVTCDEDGFQWDAREVGQIPQCQLGCCIIADQAAFVTMIRCKSLSEEFGVLSNFRSDITSEASCMATAQSQDMGACVYEQDYERLCDFTTRAECGATENVQTNPDGTFKISSERTFYKDYLCSNDDLATTCGAQAKTGCHQGDVYWYDSCDNRENIYYGEGNPTETYSHNNGKILEDPRSCGDIESNCGNCDYLVGTRCSEWDFRARITAGDKVDNYCKRTTCVSDLFSREIKNGESWCVSPGSTSLTGGSFDENVFDTTGKLMGEGNDRVGSRYFREICIDGDVIVEPCDDFRNEICISDQIETEDTTEPFLTAACRINRWQDCTIQTDKDDCNNEGLRDCDWYPSIQGLILAGISDETGETERTGVCIPKVAPGLNFWDEGTAEEICAQGNARCEVTYETGWGAFGGHLKFEGALQDIENVDWVESGAAVSGSAECSDPEWAEKANQICVGLGDCGGYVNYVGKYSDQGHNVISMEWDEDKEEWDNTDSKLKVAEATSFPLIALLFAGITGRVIAQPTITGMAGLTENEGPGDSDYIATSSTTVEKGDLTYEKKGVFWWHDSKQLDPRGDKQLITILNAVLKEYNDAKDEPETEAEDEDETTIDYTFESAMKDTIRSVAENIPISPSPKTFKYGGTIDEFKVISSTRIEKTVTSTPTGTDAPVGTIYDKKDDGWYRTPPGGTSIKLVREQDPFSTAAAAAIAKWSESQDTGGDSVIPGPLLMLTRTTQTEKELAATAAALEAKNKAKIACEKREKEGYRFAEEGKAYDCVKEGTLVYDCDYTTQIVKDGKCVPIPEEEAAQTCKEDKDCKTKGYKCKNEICVESKFDWGNTLAALATGTTAALIAYKAGDLIISFFGVDKDVSSSWGRGIGAGVGAYTFLTSWSVTEGASTWVNAGRAAGIGLIFLALTYAEKDTEAHEFQCMPWQAPSGGEDCTLCNDDDIPCSEYRCRSLGLNCEIVNKGTEEEKCVNVRPNDVNPPVIKPDENKITDEYKFDDVRTSPPSPGFKIVPEDETEECIKAFQPIEFGILIYDELSDEAEPAQCKIDFKHTESFEEMATYMGGSNLYKYSHTEKFSLPSAEDLEKSGMKIENGKDLTFFIRCRDKNGNTNEAEYAIEFCVDPTPDTTAPKIEATSIENGACVGNDKTSSIVKFYTDEPAFCKWSTEDQAYENMQNGMRNCGAKDSNLLYSCEAELTGIPKDSTDFYIRCKDDAYPENPEKNNVMMESLKFSLHGSTGLIMRNLQPNASETIYGVVDPMPVELYVETAMGCDNGLATCEYKTADSSQYITFFDTYNEDGVHTQKLNLLEGTHDISVRCYDDGQNTAEDEIEINLEIDVNAPVVARVYEEAGYLKLVTVRDSECSYTFDNCDFEFADGIVMPYANSTIHVAEWSSDKTFYIKCRDEFRNEEAACSMIVRPTKDFL